MSAPITKIYNLIILDESGSMESIKKPTIKGFNELLKSIKGSLETSPGIEQFVNFYSFNGSGIKEHLPVIAAKHLDKLADENYNPDGSTPLYDAIGWSVSKLRKLLEKEENYSVLVTILTDGEENASIEYKHGAISAMIKELSRKNWVFTYIGANHDVEKTASDLNIDNHMLFEPTSEDTKKMFSKILNSRDNFVAKVKSGSGDPGKNFFKKD